MIREYYMSKEKRDDRYKELKVQGKKLKRGTTGLQLLHPQYVSDFTGSEKHDTGLGNTVYKTRFENLYFVEELRA